MTLVTTVNYCPKEIYYRYCRGPRYASETSYYKKFENEEDNVKSNKNQVKQFSRGNFLGALIFGGYFSGGLFSRDVFPDTIFERVLSRKYEFPHSYLILGTKIP